MHYTETPKIITDQNGPANEMSRSGLQDSCADWHCTKLSSASDCSSSTSQLSAYVLNSVKAVMSLINNKDPSVEPCCIRLTARLSLTIPIYILSSDRNAFGGVGGGAAVSLSFPLLNHVNERTYAYVMSYIYCCYDCRSPIVRWWRWGLRICESALWWNSVEKKALTMAELQGFGRL